MDGIDDARSMLEQKRDQVVRATAFDWRVRCINELQKVTGLTLDSLAGYEVGYLCAVGCPDFSFPTRELSNEAREVVVKDSQDSIQRLLMFFLDRLPQERTEKGIFDTLGSYQSERGVIGARIEIYWAKLADYCRKSTNQQIEAVSKVVMLHELAHYVTHQGCSQDGVHWRSFDLYSNCPSEVLEVTAQMATEDALKSMGEAELLRTFEQLLEKQTRAYTGHRGIADRLNRIDPIILEYQNKLSSYWSFFREEIRHWPGCNNKLADSIECILSSINGYEILGNSSHKCGIDLDI